MGAKNFLDDIFEKDFQIGENLNLNDFGLKSDSISTRILALLWPSFLGLIIGFVVSLFLTYFDDNPDVYFNVTYFLFFLTIGIIVNMIHGTKSLSWWIEKGKETTQKKKRDVHIEGTQVISSEKMNKQLEYLCDEDGCIVIKTEELKETDPEFEKNPADLKLPLRSFRPSALIVGVPGGGKTVHMSRYVSQLNAETEKICIVDVKGEFVKMFYDESTDIIICPSDMRTIRIELIELFDDIVDVGVVAEIIVGSVSSKDKGGNQEHFDTSARFFLEAVFTYAKKHSLSNREILEIAQNRSKLERIKDEDEDVNNLIAPYFLSTESGEFQGVLTTLKTKSRVFQYLFLSDSLPNNTLNLKDWALNDKGGRIFFLATDKLFSVYSKLYAALCARIVNIRLSKLKNDKRLHFILNEYPQLSGVLHKMVAQGIAVGRGAKMSFIMDIQTLPQLEESIGKVGLDVLLGLCETTIVFKAEKGLKELQERMGTHTIYRTNTGQSISQADSRDGVNFTDSKIPDEPVLQTYHIKNLMPFEFYMRLHGSVDIVKSKLSTKNEDFIEQRESVESYVENPEVRIKIISNETHNIFSFETQFYSSKIAQANTREFISVDF